MNEPTKKNVDSPDEQPRRRITRRALIGAGTAAVAGGAVSGGAVLANRSDSRSGSTTQRIPFYGDHQAGVVSPQQRHALIAMYNVAVEGRHGLSDLFKALTRLGAELSASNIPTATDPGEPPPDNGALGTGGDPARLTLTVGLGATLFDRQGDPFGIASRRPKGLKPMPTFPGDDLDPAQTDSDLLLQLCCDDPLVALHALREIERETRGALLPKALHRGAQRFSPASRSKGEIAQARGLLGFKDGTGNPNLQSSSTVQSLIWLPDNAPHEPRWTADGTYMVFRKIRERIEAWDRETLTSQERLIGRKRLSGAPLDGQREADSPRYSDDRDGTKTPLDSHIRRANPRLAQTERQRILRRSFPYLDGYDSAGLLDAGLLFICFQRDPIAQFEAVKQRLSPRDARPQGLDEYLQPVGGGYYFCPHGASDPRRFIGDRLFA